jgi:hypothetical protein
MPGSQSRAVLHVALLIMCPHAKHLDDALLFEDLIDKPVLDIDAA